MSIIIGLLTAIHILVAVFLVFLVLMQKSKDQGIGAAFGGAATEAVFGGGTTTALVRMTIWCACIFLGCSLLLAILHARRDAGASRSVLQRVVEETPTAPVSQVPVLPATPTASASPALPVETTPPAETPATPPANPPAQTPAP
ncbi:MAG: preprotein translocase subunit SecG [Verrucomicrobiae bacterium]|nr:preprotein translocase subunit SecG [Verrucomicrobiae bacterium]